MQQQRRPTASTSAEHDPTPVRRDSIDGDFTALIPLRSRACGFAVKLDDIATPAKRPKFLHSRLQQRWMKLRQDAHDPAHPTDDGQQSPDDDNAFDTAIRDRVLAEHLAAEQEDARLQREDIYSWRKERSMKHVNHVREVAQQRQQAKAAKAQRLADALAGKFTAAESRHQEELTRRSQFAAHDLAHTQAVRTAAQDAFEDHRASVSATLQRRLQDVHLRRGQILASKAQLVLHSSSNQVAAARLIQAWWRWSRVARAVHIFFRCSLASSLDSVSTKTYEEVTSMIQEPAALHSAKTIFECLSPLLPSEGKCANPHRIFLSAFMMAHFPTLTFQDATLPLETALSKRAQDMITTFYAWVRQNCQQATSHNAKALWGQPFHTFRHKWVKFLRAFNDWKVADSARVIEGLVAHYNQLHELKQSVMANISQMEIDGWIPNILQQQFAIRKRLTQFKAVEALAGLPRDGLDTMAGLKRARSEFSGSSDDEGSSSKQSERPSKPTVSAFDALNTHESQPTDASAAAQPSHSANHSSEASSASTEAQASGPRSASSPERLANVRIAHEIAVDPSFELKDDREDSIEARVRLVMERAFYDALSEELHASPPNYSRVPGLLLEIRAMILDLIPERGLQMRRAVVETLDDDLIKQQIEHNAFDPQAYMRFVVIVLSKICAPSRDAEVASIATCNDMTDFFKQAHRVLRLMKIDMANYHIQSIRPHLLERAADYERENFDALLRNGQTSLDRTRAWLAKSIRDVQSNPAVMMEGAGFGDYLHEGFVSLLLGDIADMEVNHPETINMDIERFKTIALELRTAVMIACCHTIAVSNAPKLKSSTTFASQLCHDIQVVLDGRHDLAALMPNVALQVLTTVKACIAAEQLPPVPQPKLELLHNMIETLLLSKNPVRQVLLRRAGAVLKQAVGKYKIRHEQTKIHSAGLEAVHADLERLAQNLALLVTYNKEIYAKYYDTLLTEELSVFQAQQQEQQAQAQAAASASPASAQ